MSPSKSTVSKVIYVKKAVGAIFSSKRLLRQYYKRHAGKKWSFHLESLARLGFSPINPLRVESHLLANRDDAALACHSIIFKAYAMGNVANLDFDKKLDLSKNSRPMKKVKIPGVKTAASFAELEEMMKGEDKWEKVAAALDKLETEDNNALSRDDRGTTVNNKKLLLSLTDLGFFSSVSQENDRIIKATKKLFLQ